SRPAATRSASRRWWCPGARRPGAEELNADGCWPVVVDFVPVLRARRRHPDAAEGGAEDDAAPGPGRRGTPGERAVRLDPHRHEQVDRLRHPHTVIAETGPHPPEVVRAPPGS